MTDGRSSVLKITLGCALSVIVTGAAAWMVFGQNKVARSDMEAYVNEQISSGPWIIERGEVWAALNSSSQEAGELKEQVDKLALLQAQLTIDVSVLVAQLAMSDKISK